MHALRLKARARIGPRPLSIDSILVESGGAARHAGKITTVLAAECQRFSTVLEHHFDTTRFATTATPLDEGAREMADWARGWYGARPEAVFFDTPVAICRVRNSGRDRVVPEAAIEAMAAKLQPPSVEEGLESVTVYRLPDTLVK